VCNVRPRAGYAEILPDGADVAKVAYHFEGDYASGARDRPDLVGRLEEEVLAWRGAWRTGGQVPGLVVTPLSGVVVGLLDRRGLPGAQQITFLTRPQAALVLTGTRGDRTADGAWALERKLVVELDGGLVPLATAESALIQAFETEVRRPALGS